MPVKEVMTIDPMCAEPDTPLPKIAAMMVEPPLRRHPDRE